MGKLPQSGREHIVNPLPPIIDRDSRVLLLGSMPSPKSREIGFYFGNPQNRFWRVMAGLWGEKPLDSSEEKIRLCHRHHVAICDVLKACDIIGASDALKIRFPMTLRVCLSRQTLCRYIRLEAWLHGSTIAILNRQLTLPLRHCRQQVPRMLV